MEEFNFLIIPIVALFGLIFGSFATAVAYRLPRGEQFVTGRSRCPDCKHPLGFFDLFPILSWLLLAGKCRYCKKEFGSNYPLLEILLSAMFVAIYIQFGLTILSAILALVALVIVILIEIDFEHYIIPDSLNISLLILGIAYCFVTDVPIKFYLIAPLCGLGFGFFLRWIMFVWKKKEGLGMGDVKFLAAAGMFLELNMIDSFLFLSGGFGVLIAIIWKILGKGERFPFGPALSLSLFICVVFDKFIELSKQNIILYIQQSL